MPANHTQRIGVTRSSSETFWPNEVTSKAKRKPNVVVILLDDVGFGQIGCYGSSIRTPNIDALAGSGVQYSAFHTAALCSPTRAALLTGRNHHSNGMACIPQFVQGYPGYNGLMPAKNGMLSEHLVRQGYSTFAVGKWHLVPDYETSAAGPFNRWPLGRGFERYYGFLTGMIDHWHPGSLVQDNQFVDVHGGDGYHLSEDLTDRAISYIGNVHSAAPHKPFFLYLAYGAGHSPHHVAPEYADACKGIFDEGWDIERERVLARQKQMGLMADHITLPPHNKGVVPWDTLDDDHKRVYIRMQEVFAGFMTHTDEQIGRLLDFLKQIDRFDDTLVVFLSDNGASTEGGDDGRLNEFAMYNALPQNFDDAVRNIDKIGGPEYINHYPRGWSMAGNTPFREWKRSTYQGGIADPLILSWPNGIKSRGAIRDQYHHVIDIVPTIFEALGIEPEEAIAGVAQSEIEGTSFWYSVDNGSEPTRKTVQYYEMLGSRAIFHDGWKAIADHDPMSNQGDFLNDRWQLYRVADDPNETNDLSEQYPDVVRELVSLWWVEAGKYNVLPLDDRGHQRWPDPRPRIEPERDEYVYLPGTQPIFERAAVDTLNRSFTIAADIAVGDQQTEGVLLAHGSRFGGYTLFLKDGVVNFVYNLCQVREYRISAQIPSDHLRSVVVDYVKTGEHQGDVTMLLNGSVATKGRISATIPRLFPMYAALNCGMDRGLSVSDDYSSPFPFSGKINKVTVKVGEQGPLDNAMIYEAALAEQ